MKENSHGAAAKPLVSRKKLHIALIVKQMNIGGLERCVARVCNGLDCERFDVSIICLNRGGSALNWINRPDVNIVELGFRNGNSPACIYKLASTLRHGKVDIAHSHNWGTLLETQLACRLAGNVAHLHAERGTVLGPPSKKAWRNRLRAKLMRWAVSMSDGVMTNSHAVASRIHELTNLKSVRIEVIPNGVDRLASNEDILASRAEIRGRLNIPPHAVVVGSVGRLVPVKNFALALNAFATLQCTDDFSPHFVLVGEGPLEGELKSLAKERSVEDRIHFVGQRENVWPYLSAMDLYLNTSDSEGMSQSMLEAIACGLPVLATDVGDARHMIEGTHRCGEVLIHATIEELSACMDRILRDSALRNTYECNALQTHAAQYSLETMVRRFEDLYERLADAR